ncbi:LLM class flavin-dependent oxidoreductase [Pseudarthrobacter sp. NPDC058329]|uniref:LLM class flavin-dependent oxidoreductase n=1 Tax=Pseudarthrobacter sp. NPDC058329 TaxID=3346448 RepID=UPI0036D85D9E
MQRRKKIGFLTFGHWGVQDDGSRNAGSTIQDLVALARDAEHAGIDGAWLRVHHFQPMLSSALPVIAAMGAVTERIELGTAVIDMRYSLPTALGEDAATVEALVPGRLHLGVSRGAPEPFDQGLATYGVHTVEDNNDATEIGWSRAVQLREILDGRSTLTPAPRGSADQSSNFRIEPTASQLATRMWWGSGSVGSAVRAAKNGFFLLSSTLLLQDDGASFAEQQASQIRSHRDAWAAAGHANPAQAAVTRVVHIIEDQMDEDYFGTLRGEQERRGELEGRQAVTGPAYVGSVNEIAAMMRADPAVTEADWVLLALPEFTGRAYTVKTFERWGELRQQLGWS